MSTQAPRPRPLSPTRQQLDELDALLERMLALPVSAADEPAAASTAELPAPPAAPPALPEPPPPPRPAVAVPLPTPPAAPVPAVPPAAALAAVNAPAPPAVRRPPAVPRPSLPLFQPAPPPPLWLAPVVLLNRGYDRLTLRLGTTGRWLRHSGGRATLGYAGLLLLAVALGIALFDWIGWPW